MTHREEREKKKKRSSKVGWVEDGQEHKKKRSQEFGLEAPRIRPTPPEIRTVPSRKKKRKRKRPKKSERGRKKRVREEADRLQSAASSHGRFTHRRQPEHACACSAAREA